jgi:hypothetical protein
MVFFMATVKAHFADWPEDGASQHDHYLYGTPRQQ